VSFKQALSLSRAEWLIIAIKDEYDTLLANQTWSLVSLHPHRKTIVRNAYNRNQMDLLLSLKQTWLKRVSTFNPTNPGFDFQRTRLSCY